MDSAPNNPLVFTEHQLIVSVRKASSAGSPRKHDGICFFRTMEDFEKARKRSERTSCPLIATITINVRMMPSCYWEFLESGKLSPHDVFISAANYEKISALNVL